jgi:rubrerythrin
MDENMQNPEISPPYDFRKFDQIWKRVSPGLTPYADAAASLELSVQSDPSPEKTPAAAPEKQSDIPASAEPSPCCMGAAAMEMLQMLEGFIEDELSDHRYYAALCRQASAAARQTIRSIARDEAAHARTLLAVCYLITGRCYQPAVSFDRVYIGPWCPALRERYHAEACGGLTYLRAAEKTMDPCLAEILKNLSNDEYRHARELTRLLTGSMPDSCFSRI